MSAGPTPCVAAAKYQKAGTTTSQPLRSISRAASRKFAAPQEAPHQRDCVAKAKDRYWHTSPVAALQHSHQELKYLENFAILEPNARLWRAFLTTPHHGLGPTQRCELRRAERSLTDGEELVELRRFYARAG